MNLMSSINTDHVDNVKVTYFALHVIYNCPKRKKSSGDSRYAMLYSRVLNIREEPLINV